MNRVLSGYFDDAHRGLQRQSKSLAAGVGSTSQVQLPPLRPGGGAGVGVEEDPSAWGLLNESKSLGSLEFTRQEALRGVQADQYQQALQTSAKLARKVKALQDQLSVTSAKKEAFKAQAQRLEREFRSGRDQNDALQKDLLEAKREADYLTKEAQEAIQMMTEMRKAHIAEVKLLQRGLAARGGSDQTRNRVNEMADLVDKVGRAVVQRDEAIRDKTQMQAQLNKALKDLRSSSDDCAKFRKQNKQLSDSLKEARRKGQYAPPKPSVGPEDDSDAEFEDELRQFEKRFEILEEGPAGLDVLASNLSKDKQNLEKKVRAQQDTIKSLNSTIDNWKQLGGQKDQQIQDLSAKLEKVMRDHALFEEQIAQKQREIALQVEEERAALEARISELELECDNARADADGMEKASTRLTRELVKVHEQYSGGAPAPAAGGGASGAGAAGGGTAGGEGGGAPGGNWTKVASADNAEAKTGERLKLEVYKDGEAVELRAREAPDGEEFRVPVDAGLLKELDEADPWADLFGRAGVDPGPPRRVVVGTRLGEKEVQLQPSGASVLLTAYRYSAKRFYLAGMDLLSQKMLSLAVTESNLTQELEAKIRGCTTDAAVFDVLAAALRAAGVGGGGGGLKLAG
mmetsp:Transcript_94241/g.236518  ORF Transcript_94241/g.236518 Transcript_94241/m.236518 type:complete len:629 (-) Transcript_94241:19-1905(-)